jgi:hypothetical protein
MINLNLLDRYRVRDPRPGMHDDGDDTCGAFEIPSQTSTNFLRVIASVGAGWDHVSVSLQHRNPYWSEMEYIRRMFFDPDEAVMQYHAPIRDYVDGSYPGNCATCLHMWRPHDVPIPTPPKWMIGGMSHEEATRAAMEHMAQRNKNRTAGG